MTLITVVVPIYKVEEYLSQCLNSIINQTYDHIEILCVDDFSPDKSADIVKSFSESDNRVRLLSHSYNQGLGPARNTGILEAKGDYIAFIDSDDWIAPNMLEMMHRNMEVERADIVQCSAMRMKNEEEQHSLGSYPDSAGVRSKNLIHSMFGEDPRFVGAAWNKLYKTSLFRENNIYYPPIIFEDVATTPRLLMMSEKVVSLSESYLFYRQRDDSIVNADDINSFIGRIDGLFSAADILTEFCATYKQHSLEFIMNFRKFFFPQIKKNIRLAKKIGLEEKCLNAAEAKLRSNSPCIPYFFPDIEKILQDLTNVS